MFSFVDKLMIYTLPTLLKLLIKDKDMVDKLENEDEWDIPKSASNCLSLLASCCKELLVPQIIRFIEQNLLVSNQIDWNQKEAAIIAFGSILNGPSKSKMKPLVEQVKLKIYLYNALQNQLTPISNVFCRSYQLYYLA